MSQVHALAFPEENLIGWEHALYAFLEGAREYGPGRRGP